MEQQEVAQPQALPGDVESILQPISADHHQQVEPTAEPVAQPVVAQPAPQPVAPAPPAEPHVPLHVLLEERKERQAYQRQIQQIIEAQQRASQPQPQPIDPVADPEGAFRALAQHNAALAQQVQEQAFHQRANTSEMLAKKEFGAQTVETAREAALQAGLGRHFMAQPDPYQALVEWHRGQVAAKEIGDPTTYKERLKAEILAELTKGQPAAQARPGVPQILPPSLSSATRANTASPVIQDTSDFFKNQLFAKPQRT